MICYASFNSRFLLIDWFLVVSCSIDCLLIRTLRTTVLLHALNQVVLSDCCFGWSGQDHQGHQTKVIEMALNSFRRARFATILYGVHACFRLYSEKADISIYNLFKILLDTAEHRIMLLSKKKFCYFTKNASYSEFRRALVPQIFCFI